MAVSGLSLERSNPTGFRPYEILELTGQFLIGPSLFLLGRTRMPRVKTDEKLEEILEASSRVFSEKDFHEVLIDEIAEVGGIGKGTVYRYFRTKEDLYFATILPQEASPTKRLERIAREILTFFWNQRSLLMLLYRDERTLRARHGGLRERHDRLVRLVKEAIVEGIERREYRGVDPQTAAELFLGMIRGINIFRRDEDTVEALVAEIVGVFTRGVARSEGER
jgi:AcrR family transcriptional regulator